MKRLLICLCFLGSLCQQAAALEWLTDLPSALARAKKENKAVLLDFTGSDWCGWCMKLKREVFDTFDFAAYANNNVVMVEVDFPRRKLLSPDQATANESLATKYRITGYPTIILLNSEGAQIGRSGYVPGGPSAFIASIDKFPGMPHPGVTATPASAVAAGPAQRSAPAAQAQGVLLAVTPAPAPRYGELTLKGISGPPNRRMALINNEPLMTGESAFVKTMDKSVEVTVKEIRADAVVIVVNGQSRELKLGQR